MSSCGGAQLDYTPLSCERLEERRKLVVTAANGTAELIGSRARPPGSRAARRGHTLWTAPQPGFRPLGRKDRA